MDTPPNDPPRHLTSFVGRERELAEVNRLLAGASGGARLLTLTGPGGCGKTRLALRAADDCRATHADGVAVVELAALTDPTLAPQFVASALGVRDVPGRPILTALAEHLRPRDVLIVLDNCEHLVEACAALVETLLRACPHLCILATSREMLGVPGEIAWAVPALSTPGPDALLADPATLVPEVRRYEAIRLFVDRARLVVPSFEVTPENAATLARICRRLDGMPLPIELAAARVRLLSLDQIDERLSDCFQVLAAGNRMVAARHRTLRATIDWSYGLLDESERRLFRRLSVFVGGFTLETAEAVYGASLELLGHLVDKSLVVVEQPARPAARYRLLETIRQYAGEQLLVAGETPAARRAHARYFLGVAENAEPWLTSGARALWLDRLEVEHDNLRAALEWSRQDGGEIEVGLRLVGALWWFWNMRDHLSEGSARAAAVLAHPGAREATPARARALTSAGALAWLEGDYAAAGARLTDAVHISRTVGDARGLAYALTLLGLAALRLGDQAVATSVAAESVALFRAADDPWGLAWALNNLGYVSSTRGDDAGARAHLTESLERFRALDDPWGVGLPLSNLGYLAYRLGDYPRARARLEESVAIFRALDHFWLIPRTLNSLGNVARCQGEHARAAALYEESLRLCREHGDHLGRAEALHNLARVAQSEGDLPRAAALFREALTTFSAQGQRRGVGACLVGLAGIAALGGRAELATRLFAAGEAHRGHANLPLSPAQRADAERDLARARRRLSAAAFDAAWQAGRALALAEAIEDALGFDVAASPAAGRTPSPLTAREEEVATLVARGLSNRQIADALVISERTADSHVSHILTRLGFTSRAQIAAWAVERAQAPRRDG